MTAQPPNAPTVPSTPDPSTADLVYEAIQDVLMIAGALGVTIPAALQSQQVDTQIAGGIAGLIGLGMSVYDKWRAARAAHAAATASAKAGHAVKPV